MRFDGTIKTWNDDRGFGFIEALQGGDEIFVHIKAFSQKTSRPQPGQRVSFEIELGPQGKKRAKNVEPLRARNMAKPSNPTRHTRGGNSTLLALPAFAVVAVIVALLWHPPPVWIAIYGGTSVAAFIAYVVDKSASEKGAWRTPEATLHMLALAGGWPGALLAQQLLRHKTAKAEFRVVFWFTVLLNVAAFAALCSPWFVPMLRGV